MLSLNIYRPLSADQPKKHTRSSPGIEASVIDHSFLLEFFFFFCENGPLLLIVLDNLSERLSKIAQAFFLEEKLTLMLWSKYFWKYSRFSI